MLLDEYLQDLQKLTKKKPPTYEQVAAALDLGSKQAVSNRIYRKQKLKQFEIDILDDTFKKDNQSTQIIDDTPHLTLDYYPDIFGSCGTGEFVLSQEKQQIQVPDNVFFKKFSKVKKYSVINAYGDSMQPFIYSGDKLIVEHWNGEQIIDNQVYVFCYDNEIFVKRLTKNINQLVIKSDNTFYDVIKLTGDELSKIIIVGQIVGLMRDLR